MGTTFNVDAGCVTVLEREYVRLLTLDEASLDSVAMEAMNNICFRILGAIPIGLSEGVVIRLVRYIYSQRMNIDSATEDMYRFLRAFFWMYNYSMLDLTYDDNLKELREVEKIFDRLRYFYMQDSAVFTQYDCVRVMNLVTKYYYHKVNGNDYTIRLCQAQMHFNDAISCWHGDTGRTIAQSYANNGWHCVMDYIEDILKDLERERTSKELEEEDRKKIRKEEPMEEMVQEELPVNSIRCDKCGKVINLYEAALFNDKEEHWCRDCANKFLEEHDDYIKCYQCRAIVPKDEATKDYAGDWFCEECTENFLTTCEECGDVVWVDDCHWIESEEREVCNTCFDRYYETCTHCGKTFRRSDMEEVEGEHYCHDCYYGLFEECHECGEIIRRDSSYIDDDGYVYCESCYRRIVSGILPYHDDDVRFEVNHMNEDYLNEVTIGIEHEVGCDTCDKGCNAREILNMMNQHYEYENIAIFEDSSVDGFEIVSQPMTVKYFKEKYLPEYKKAILWMENAGMVGTDEGGMHIHFKIPCLNRVMVARLANIFYGNPKDNYSEVLQEISRRARSNFERWCSTDDRYYTTKDLLESSYLYKCVGGVRNTILNYDSSRTNTYELRMFNSTLDVDEYIASVEFVIALTDFVREDDGRGPYVTLRDFISYINEHQEDYPTIHQQLCSLDIYSTLYIKIKKVPKLPKVEIDTTALDEAFDNLYPDGVEDSIEHMFEPLHISEVERNWIEQTVNEIFSRV